MKIQILHLLEGARQSEGLTVIIDVFRAFSLECYMMAQGAAAIHPVGSEAIARQLKAEHPDWLLAGERGGVMLEGFDFGNSPTQIEGMDLTGRTIIHTTSAGTQGIAGAVNASELLTGSLVNASAIAAYIKAKQPETVSLVCMGLSAAEESEEDTLCAEYIRSLLLDDPIPAEELNRRMDDLRHTAGARFFLPDMQDSCPARDFILCTRADQFNFVLQVEKEGADKATVCRIDL